MLDCDWSSDVCSSDLAVHVLTPTATVRRIINMTAVAVVDALAHMGGQGRQ
jgi:hypothetical protein